METVTDPRIVMGDIFHPAISYIERPMIYVAGPYSSPDPVQNSNKAIMAAEFLLELGYTPVIPHLTLMWHLVVPHELEFWYEYDISMLSRCDCIVRLDGASLGADKEVEFAIDHDLAVFKGIENVPPVATWKEAS